MNSLQKMGGIAALYEAIAYLIAMVGYLLVIGVEDVDPVQKVAILLANQSLLTILNLVAYVIFGIFLVVLALALYERLKGSSPALAQTATALALIWAVVVIASGMVANYGMGIVTGLYDQDPAQAATVWLAVDTVAIGLGGGGGEILGGIWMLLVSWAALRAGEFSKGLNYLGLIVGVAGLVSLVPVLGELRGLVFGLGQLVWFIWLGIVMLRSKKSVPSEAADILVPHHRTS